MDINKALKDLQHRVEKLEKVVFTKGEAKSLKASDREFKGATGGLRYLASKGFFNRKRAFREINEALASHGYHYSKQAVQTPLNVLSKPGAMLVSLREGGRKVYATRK
jgi:hypothetical protein